MDNPPRFSSVYDAVLVEEHPSPYARRGLSDVQFSLLALFLMLTLSCFFAACLARFGVRYCLGIAGMTFLGLLLVTPVALIWGVYYRILPEPTKYATIFGLMALMLLLPVPCLLLQSREVSRRNACTNNLKQLGVALHHYELSYPNRSPSQSDWNEEVRIRLSGDADCHHFGTLHEP